MRLVVRADGVEQRTVFVGRIAVPRCVADHQHAAGTVAPLQGGDDLLLAAVLLPRDAGDQLQQAVLAPFPAERKLLGGGYDYDIGVLPGPPAGFPARAERAESRAPSGRCVRSHPQTIRA